MRPTRAVDPVGVRNADTGEERPRRRLPDPVPAVLDHDRREHEVDAEQHRQGKRVAPRDEHERRGGGEPDRERHEAQRAEVDPLILQPPPGQQASVSETAEVFTNRANGTASGNAPAITAAITRVRRATGTTASREASPNSATTANGAT